MQGTPINLQLPSGGTVTLRPVLPNDDEFLFAVYASTREEELAQAQWAEKQKEQFLHWQFGLQREEYEARFPDAKYYVVLLEDQPVGKLWIGEDENQIRLLDIAILPEFHNRGVGTLLMKHLIGEAGKAGKPLRHFVFVLNNDAHRFYERLGFVMIQDLDAYKHMEWRPK